LGIQEVIAQEEQLVIDGKYNNPDGRKEELERYRSGRKVCKAQRGRTAVRSAEEDHLQRRREEKPTERSRAVGSHSEIPSAVRSDRSSTRFTIGKSQGEILKGGLTHRVSHIGNPVSQCIAALKSSKPRRVVRLRSRG
jgi:hypothetical protein